MSAELKIERTAQELTALCEHANKDSTTTLKTVVNPDASDGHDEMMDLNVCGIGNSAYLEWVTEYGDPIGDVFDKISLSSEELNELIQTQEKRGSAPRPS